MYCTLVTRTWQEKPSLASYRSLAVVCVTSKGLAQSPWRINMLLYQRLPVVQGLSGAPPPGPPRPVVS